ncbi:arylesterase [Sulfurimonas sp. HSL3-7]|uniref:arylesterase n=1 Tax=Sulfonitrofixus jiaomeiensis TaxID=3131938 RepID=UPI0031F908EE
MNKTNLAALFLGLILVLLFLNRFDTPSPERQRLGSDARVLAFGDSLTYGYGAVEMSYPKQLQTRIGRSVINAGISGEVSSAGLKRLPGLLERYHPALVILCHGGNDILRQSSREQLKLNLIAMIQLSRKSGAEVLLVGVPGFGLFGPNTVALYEEIAQEKGVLFEGNILEKIESEPALKSDRIHPNAIGYGLMAEAFEAVIKENGLL